MNARDAFMKNLPIFSCTVRGNAVDDSEGFTSKSGNDFIRFKVAHSFSKDGITAFIKVVSRDVSTVVAKGDYVEVSGDYKEEMNGEYLNRGIFASSVEVLGTKAESKPAKVDAKSKARK